jgi:cytochrome c-type biogenesis protein CcmE
MEKNQVTICSLLFTFALLCLLFIPGIVKAQPIKTTPTEILQNQNKYAGKMVQVEGRVVNPKFSTNKQGFGYTTFRVIDSQNCPLPVYSYGTLPIKEGDKVKITGTFHKIKQVNPSYNLYNAIDASGVEVRRR